MGWNATGSASGSVSAGDNTKLEYVKVDLGTVNGDCYQADTGRSGHHNGSPITVTLTAGGASRSVSVTNVVRTTSDSRGNKYPVNHGQSYTFNFGTEIDGGTIGWSISWPAGSVLACGSGGGFYPSFHFSGGESPDPPPPTPPTHSVEYTMTLDPKNGSAAIQRSGSGTFDIDVWGPVYVNILDSDTPTWIDHRFLGWFTAESGGTQISTGQQALYNDVTYYAHWETFLRFDLNGGDYTFPEYWRELNTHMNLPSFIPIREGFNFHSWADDSDSKYYERGQQYKFEKPKTLRARWVRRKLNVNVYKNVVLSQPDTYTLDYGQTINLTAQQHYQDYRFVGWDTDEHQTGIKKAQNINCLWDVTDYYRRTEGNWRRPFKGYGNYVTWIYNGVAHTEFRQTGENCLNPSGITVERSGCTFIGWVEDPLSETPYTRLVMSTDQITLYALWKYNDIVISSNISSTCTTTGSADKLTGRSIVPVNGMTIGTVRVSAKSSVANKPVSQFTSSFLYLCISGSQYINTECDIAAQTSQACIRGFVKSGSSIVEDTRWIGAGNRAFTYDFAVPYGTKYLTMVAGPDCTSAIISECTIKGIGRKITG